MIPYTRTMMTSGWTRARNNLTDLTGLVGCVIRNPSKDIHEVNLRFTLCRLGKLDCSNSFFPALNLISPIASASASSDQCPQRVIISTLSPK
jgi:hypothetical protein